MRWGNVACMQKMSMYSTSVEISEGIRPLGRARRVLEDKIRKDIREIVWEVLKYMHLDQDRDQWWALVNAVMNLTV
jgi:hypothetical protein